MATIQEKESVLLSVLTANKYVKKPKTINTIAIVENGINRKMGDLHLKIVGLKHQNRYQNGNVIGGQEGWIIRFNVKNPKGKTYFDADGVDIRDKEYYKRVDEITNSLTKYFINNNSKTKITQLKSSSSIDTIIDAKKIFSLRANDYNFSDFSVFIGSADDVLKFIEDVRKLPIIKLMTSIDCPNDVNCYQIDDIFTGYIHAPSLYLSGVSFGKGIKLDKVIGSNVIYFDYENDENKKTELYEVDFSSQTICIDYVNKQKCVNFDVINKKDNPTYLYLRQHLRNIVAFAVYGDYLKGTQKGTFPKFPLNYLIK